MKTVLSVQDLSCVGRCSLTVALPVLSTMGCRCSVLPTAVLSTHTGFPDPKVIPLTEHMGDIDAHFEKIGVTFDAVTTGYLANAAQAEAVVSMLARHKAQGSIIIVDPAMGDHGKLYSGLCPDHVQAMAAVCRHGDILLPNVTEAALLAGMPYRPDPDESYLRALCCGLDTFCATATVITGISRTDGKIGFFVKHAETGFHSYEAPLIPKHFHGTGDLFSAVFTGGFLSGSSVYDSAVMAADFVRDCVASTPAVTPHGVAFETQLSRLYEKSC